MDRRTFLGAAAKVGALAATSSLPLSSVFSSTPRTTRALSPPSAWSDSLITACWIGQSTILMNIYGTVVITDPVLFNSIGVRVLGSMVGISRLVQPAWSIDEIPRPDIILLSHAHMDHMDLPTLERLCAMYPNHITCICAKNTKDIIDDLPWKKLRELDWWESVYHDELSISAVEVLHNGWRLPWEPDRREGSLNGRSYNGYVLMCRNKTVVFAGDTAYTEAFSELSSLNIDCAFMPIGAYQGYTNNHCTPEEAVNCAQMMRAQTVAPMHCMTFRQSSEAYQEPMQRFLSSSQACGLRAGWTGIGSTIVIGEAPTAERARRAN